MQIDFYDIFIAALLLASSHCVGMCSPIVMACYKSITPGKNKITPFLLYAMAKYSGYMIIFFLLYKGSEIFHFEMKDRAIFMIIFGFLILLFGISNLKIMKFGISIYNFPLGIDRIFSYIIKSDNILRFYLIGLLNSFLPCSLIYIYIMKALSYSSFQDAFLVMSIFSLTTIIPLFVLFLSIDIVGKFLKNKILNIILSIVIMTMGIRDIKNGFKMYNMNSMKMEKVMK